MGVRPDTAGAAAAGPATRPWTSPTRSWAAAAAAGRPDTRTGGTRWACERSWRHCRSGGAARTSRCQVSAR